MLCAKYNLQSERTFETPCTSHLTEPTRARETPAGCRPRARGMPKGE